ncbi:olfactory receptor 5G25-like [Engystomops pustulosus]|uniref:olfactory receptor 5G25-like n=1 Tax=Engystomops pustulosus TaxID=76066 RepID=UPI003AFB5176
MGKTQSDSQPSGGQCWIRSVQPRYKIMSAGNQTIEPKFILLGFQSLHHYRSLLFLVFLILFLATILGNLFIIVLVSQSENLSSPMYFFLSHLSSCDFLLSAVIVPFMLNIISRDSGSVSFYECLIQFYLFGALATTECLLLSVMSYDRYVAICNPLRYSSIMNLRKCLLLVLPCWVLSFSVLLNTTFQVFSLQFCGPNIIDHFFCDLAPLLQLSCSDTSSVETWNLVTGVPATFLPLMYITGTYTAIFVTILKIPSTIGRQKAFFTCSSHLTVVSLFFGTLMVAYLFLSKNQSSSVNKVLSLLYTVMTPLVNPIIYSLRNREIKVAFYKLVYTVRVTNSSDRIRVTASSDQVKMNTSSDQVKVTTSSDRVRVTNSADHVRVTTSNDRVRVTTSSDQGNTISCSRPIIGIDMVYPYRQEWNGER